MKAKKDPARRLLGATVRLKDGALGRLVALYGGVFTLLTRGGNRACFLADVAEVANDPRLKLKELCGRYGIKAVPLRRLYK